MFEVAHFTLLPFSLWDEDVLQLIFSFLNFPADKVGGNDCGFLKPPFTETLIV